MPRPSHLTKITYCGDEYIWFLDIYSSTKDDLFRMKVKCDFCSETQCRCFKSIREAVRFEGFICSNRCFVLMNRGDNETLDKIIDDMKLKVPLESLDKSVFNDIVSGMEDELFNDYECAEGEMCEI